MSTKEKDPVTGEAPPPTSEDVIIKDASRSNEYAIVGGLFGSIFLGYLCYCHFYRKQPGYLALPFTSDGLAVAIGKMIGATVAVYLLFVGLGFGLSSYSGYAKCGKSNNEVSGIAGAWYALTPAISYIIIRLYEGLRIQYDRFLGIFGVQDPKWSIALFLSTWILYSTITLMSESERSICKPTPDESEAFKQAIKEKQASRKAAGAGPPGITR